ncbi:type II toxin-antitoxin system RelE/ParE family toxin [Mesorhizobium sp. J428]|uniref:type II toxin-antitoxin system RelE/ParE family toxin n=1 Tax=Mesorhizobium sp. J428 TaxID=2898440 RepID=UPI0035B19B9F
MTLSVRILETALADLESLHDYILDQSDVARAWAYASRIRKHCEKLADFPYSGRAANHISPGLRTLIFERAA